MPKTFNGVTAQDCNCGQSDVTLTLFLGSYAVRCRSCDHFGKFCDTAKEAIESWNSKENSDETD